MTLPLPDLLLGGTKRGLFRMRVPEEQNHYDEQGAHVIQLYLWDSCPFCRNVSKAAAQFKLVEGQDFEVVSAGPGTPGRLIVEERGGKAMVPFLIDGETSLYESDDIIDYLRSKITTS